MLTKALFGSGRWNFRSLCMLISVASLAFVSGTIAVGQDTAVERATETSDTPPTATELPSTSTPSKSVDQSPDASDPVRHGKPTSSSNRVAVLIGSLTIFVLAIFVGFEVINKVPPTLHTPLMSGSNAISGITIVGAILATGFDKIGFGSFLGMAAIVLAMINVAGGFWVTHRMLSMFKKKK